MISFWWSEKGRWNGFFFGEMLVAAAEVGTTTTNGRMNMNSTHHHRKCINDQKPFISTDQDLYSTASLMSFIFYEAFSGPFVIYTHTHINSSTIMTIMWCYSWVWCESKSVRFFYYYHEYIWVWMFYDYDDKIDKWRLHDEFYWKFPPILIWLS